ncbi:MAG: sugar ABC transporter ATP-binding protein [Lachnospiraceae bacterium]
MGTSVEFRDIEKVFPGVKALDRISFQASGGEVVALVGENGAGKSTLLKVLNGDYQPDGGTYLLDGVECHFKTPQQAIQAGIGIIYQERQIIPYLTVAENIFMEDMPSAGGFINFKEMHQRTQDILDEFKLPIRPTDRVRNLSVAHQQMVEIMKSYRRHPKVLAFDEPTASLSDAEIDTLFALIRQLKEQGIIILYVSHRMKEIFQITDKVVIMKDGSHVKTLCTSETTETEIVRLMVGRNLGDIFQNLERNTSYGDTILHVEHLTNESVRDISFSLRKGEILGFAGLVGARRTEVMRAIFGADPITSGCIFLDGERLQPASPKDSIVRGIALCPEDRKEQGIVANRSIENNISIAILDQLSTCGFIDLKKEHEVAENGVQEFRVKTHSIHKKIKDLSGGNQQKVILARWMAANPKVLILDEPTKGIDVGSKSEIYKMACDLARQGIGVIVISSELPEIIGLCDRIIVMCQGHITGELGREEATDEKILTFAMQDMLGGNT